MSAYPKIQQVNDALEKIPAFQRAHAYCQPDTPPDRRISEDKLPRNAASASAIAN